MSNLETTPEEQEVRRQVEEDLRQEIREEWQKEMTDVILLEIKAQFSEWQKGADYLEAEQEAKNKAEWEGSEFDAGEFETEAFDKFRDEHYDEIEESFREEYDRRFEKEAASETFQARITKEVARLTASDS